MLVTLTVALGNIRAASISAMRMALRMCSEHKSMVNSCPFESSSFARYWAVCGQELNPRMLACLRRQSGTLSRNQLDFQGFLNGFEFGARTLHRSRDEKGNGAGDGDRTRDIRLGKPTFYR